MRYFHQIVDKDEKYDFPSELPDIPLPWIQALEPTNLMVRQFRIYSDRNLHEQLKIEASEAHEIQSQSLSGVFSCASPVPDSLLHRFPE